MSCTDTRPCIRSWPAGIWADMGKTAGDVLTEWGVRGYCSAALSDSDKAKYQSYIQQARQSILSYCNLPLAVSSLPDGLFYPWVEIAYAIMKGGVFEQSQGIVTSIKEDDTSINFSTSKNTATVPLVDYSNILNRFRCLY